MTRRTEPPTASTPVSPPRIVAPGRRGITSLVLSAIEDGSLALLPGRGLDPCDVVEASVPAMSLGDLGDDDLAWAERHLETCSDCRALLGQTRRLDALLGQGTARLTEAVQPSIQRSQAVARTGNRATLSVPSVGCSIV